MSWTALVTHRWAEGIIDVVEGAIVDADGTLTASYTNQKESGRMTFPHGEWHQTYELATAAAESKRANRIELLRGQILEIEAQISRLEELQFAIDRDGPSPEA